MENPALKSDCANCAGLCCMALAIDKSALFAMDKAAGVACQNLGTDHKCTIHNTLKSRGFQGCINYDCAGAGQRVSRQVFKGKSWRDQPELLAPMMVAFHGMRQVQEQLVLLSAAKSLALSADQLAQAERFETALAGRQNWRVEELEMFQTSTVHADIRAFVKSLAPLFALGAGHGGGPETRSAP